MLVGMFQNQDSLNALLINKKKGTAFGSGKSIYKLVFQTKRGILSFQVDEEKYDRVAVGSQGRLTFAGLKLISFGKWIDESLFSAYNRPDLPWLRS